MRMQREDVPKNRRLANPVEHSPDDRCSALRDDGATRSAVKRYTAQQCAGLPEMYFVSQGYACPAAASIAEVACDPDCINAHSERRFQESHQIAFAHTGCVRLVMDKAAIAVRIEDGGKTGVCEGRDEKLRCLHDNFSVVRQ